MQSDPFENLIERQVRSDRGPIEGGWGNGPFQDFFHQIEKNIFKNTRKRTITAVYR